MRGLGEIASPAQDAPPLAFGSAAPHAVLDAIQQRVLEALGRHGTRRAHALRGFHAGTVGREELGGIDPAGPISASQLLNYLAGGSDHYPVVADYNFGGSDTVIVPEPSSLILLALGGLSLAFRRAKAGRRSNKP